MSKRRVLYLNGCLASLLFLAMASYTHALQPGIPCLQLTYSGEAFRNIFDGWRDSGQDCFRRHFLIDFPFLLSYGLFGYRLSRWTNLLASLSFKLREALTWSLPAAAVLDAGENLLHLYLSSSLAPKPEALYLVAGVVATSKWLLIVIFLLGAGAAGLGNRFRQAP